MKPKSRTDFDFSTCSSATMISLYSGTNVVLHTCVYPLCVTPVQPVRNIDSTDSFLSYSKPSIKVEFLGQHEVWEDKIHIIPKFLFLNFIAPVDIACAHHVN